MKQNRRIGLWLEAHDPFLIYWLAMISDDGMAEHGDMELAAHGKLTAVQADLYRRDLIGLPPFPPASRAITLGERFCVLQILTNSAHGRPGGFSAPGRTVIPIDYAQIARETNLWFDRDAKVFHRRPYLQQISGISMLKRQLAQAKSFFSPQHRN